MATNGKTQESAQDTPAPEQLSSSPTPVEEVALLHGLSNDGYKWVALWRPTDRLAVTHVVSIIFSTQRTVRGALHRQQLPCMLSALAVSGWLAAARHTAPRLHLSMELCSTQGFHMPAEWEPHQQCWMGWPRRPDNWREYAGPAQKAFAAVATAIMEFEPVTLAVPDPRMARAARQLFYCA